MIRKFVKKIISALDSRFKTNLYGKAVNLEGAWYNLGFLNAIRRNTGSAMIKLKYKLGLKDKNPLKLHLGCGSRHFEGYINIDWRKTRATDLVCDVRNLPYRDNSVELIECYHILEHLPVCLMANLDPGFGEKYALVINTLKEWQKILKSGGKLIIEAPDLDKLIEEYIRTDNNKREELIAYMYGGYRNNNIFDIHRWGPNKYRLRYILKKAGFRKIQFEETQDYHKELFPCLRVESVKGTKI